MDFDKFRAFQNRRFKPSQREVVCNSTLSETDPTQAFTVGQFVTAASTGKPVPNFTEQPVVFNGLSVDDIGITESIHADKFEVAQVLQLEQRNINKKVKSLKREKENENENEKD